VSGSRYRFGLRLLAMPYVVGVSALVIVPALVTVAFAFMEFDGLSPAGFAGLETFRSVLAEPELHRAVGATLRFLLLAIPFRITGGLLLALLANGPGRLAATTRLAVYTPAVIPDPAVAVIWLWIVNPFYGPVGALVRAFGGTPGPILLDSGGALLTIAAIAAFAIGEGFLVMLAARREVSETLYDAARLEGATALARFRRITLPFLAPTLALLVARDLLTSMQAVLVPTLLLTRGGPLDATKTLPVLVFERGFVESYPGEGAAIAVLLLLGAVVAVLLVGAVLWLGPRWRRARRRKAFARSPGGPLLR
jgi:multiple sugar transport system permease protein